MSTFIWPNVVPQHLEQDIGLRDIIDPGWFGCLRELPSLLSGPLVLQAVSTQAVCRVGFRVDALYPNPASQVQPEQMRNLDRDLHLWLV